MRVEDYPPGSLGRLIAYFELDPPAEVRLLAERARAQDDPDELAVALEDLAIRLEASG